MIGKPLAPSQKYKNVVGEATFANVMFQDIVSPFSTIEGHQICANTKYVAIPWKGLGGQFTVKLLDEYGRIPHDTPTFKGHTAAIQDLEFSPFHTDLLATASADKTLKLWKMPPGKMEQSSEQCEATLTGHSKKVMLMQWHPSAEFTLASAGEAGGVRIWDVRAEKNLFNFDKNASEPKSMAWNHNGSLLSLFTKDKKMHVIDPRQQAAVISKDGHMGIKSARVQWKGQHNLMISVGFSDKGVREFMVHDPRNWATPLAQDKLDKNTQVCWTYYDDSTNLFYVTNKGSTLVQLLYFSEKGERSGKPEFIPALSDYNSKESYNYFYFLPKQLVDPMRKEVMRALKLTGKTAEYVTFKVPRKNEPGFSPDLFPYHRAQQAAMTCEEWAKGADSDPLLELFNPEIPREDSNLKPGSGAKKVAPARPKVEEQKAAEQPVAAASKPEVQKVEEKPAADTAPQKLIDTGAQSVFAKRQFEGKPVPACQEALDTWRAGHAQSKTYLNMPLLANGSVDLGALNKRRAAVEEKLNAVEASWPKWKQFKDDCAVEIINLPVSHGLTLGQPLATIKLYKIRPKTISETSKDNVGYVWAHGGGAILYSAEAYLYFMCRMACETNCVVFSVDFRNGPENKSPAGMLDFYCSVKYVHDNAASLGIDKGKICVGGQSGGGWICLGAVYHMIKASEAHIIKSQFLTCPMISNQVAGVAEGQLLDYEKPNVESIGNYFHHLVTDEERGKQSPLMYPGLMGDADLAKGPPTVVFTSEFDYLRRDATHFIERLKKAGKYLDHQDMPGTHHGYQYDGKTAETDTFFQEITLAIDKYVRQ